MAANKVLGARAALVWSVPTAELARQHNNANLISIGARQHTVEEAILYIDTFIQTPFSFVERHERRIAQLAEYEKTGLIAGREID
jgi:ribose 5-phosphate isomerase B